MDVGLEVERNSSLISALKNYSSVETLAGNDKFLCENCICKQEA